MILVDACCRAGVWNTQDLSQDHWSISAAWLPGIPPGWLSHCVFTIISYHYISYHYIAVPLQRRILHISWHDFVSNDEVLSRTGWFDVPYIVRKRRLGLLGHVARLRNDVPANQTLQICTTTTNNNWITNTLQIFSKIKHKICHMIPASLYQMPCSMDNYA